MKKIYTVILLLISIHGLAQEDKNTIKLEDLKTPNAPGFSLLDISPTSIERPTNPKQFAVGLLNHTDGGSLLPKNFAVEFCPYWFTKPKNETVYKYLNIKNENRSNIASGIFRKLSLSIASVYNDSAKNLQPKTNYLSFGVRTNVLTIRSKKQNDNMDSAVSGIAGRIGAIMLRLRNPDGTPLSPDAIEEALNGDAEYKSLSKSLAEELTAKPVFQLDVAYAYSEAFKNNTYSDHRFNRGGFWANAVLSTPLSKKVKDYLGAILFYRNLKDNVMFIPNSLFNKKSASDIGLRAEYTNGNLAVSFEYLKRKYSGGSELDSERSVGILQYKVTDGLYIFGTFGKNFGKINNVFTVFGLNWGFGGTPLALN